MLIAMTGQRSIHPHILYTYSNLFWPYFSSFVGVYPKTYAWLAGHYQCI